MPNQPMHLTGASRLAQIQIVGPGRLAPAADLVVISYGPAESFIIVCAAGPAVLHDWSLRLQFDL